MVSPKPYILIRNVLEKLQISITMKTSTLCRRCSLYPRKRSSHTMVSLNVTVKRPASPRPELPACLVFFNLTLNFNGCWKMLRIWCMILVLLLKSTNFQKKNNFWEKFTFLLCRIVHFQLLQYILARWWKWLSLFEQFTLQYGLRKQVLWCIVLHCSPCKYVHVSQPWDCWTAWTRPHGAEFGKGRETVYYLLERD